MIIDLKFVTISVSDGYAAKAGSPKIELTLPSGTPAIDHLAGYLSGVTAMDIDGLTGAVIKGDTFTILSDPTVYTIVTHTETSGNTKHITFTPGLASGYSDDDTLSLIARPFAIGTTKIFTKGFTGAIPTQTKFTIGSDITEYTVTGHAETAGKTTYITLSPALVVAVSDEEVIHIINHSLNIKIGEGTLTYDEKRKMQYILDRGLLDDVREGDEEPIDVRFDFLWEHLTATGTDTLPTIEDAFKQRGLASTWISSDPDTCRPYSVDMILNFVPPCEGENAELIVLSQFRWESFNHEAKQGIVAVTGKCNVKNATITRPD